VIQNLSEVELQRLRGFQEMPSAHQLLLTDSDEPGEPLILCLTFESRSTSEPWSNKPVILYHTNSFGDYEMTDESEPLSSKIMGEGMTDSEGRLFVRSILPGNYGNGTDNRHIHTEVPGAKPLYYDVLFKFFRNKLTRENKDYGDQHFRAELYYGMDSILVGFATIRVKP
jgi:protocatechuate 3,4-dioxygenase beta subunit